MGDLIFHPPFFFPFLPFPFAFGPSLCFFRSPLGVGAHVPVPHSHCPGRVAVDAPCSRLPVARAPGRNGGGRREVYTTCSIAWVGPVKLSALTDTTRTNSQSNAPRDRWQARGIDRTCAFLLQSRADDDAHPPNHHFVIGQTLLISHLPLIVPDLPSHARGTFPSLPTKNTKLKRPLIEPWRMVSVLFRFVVAFYTCATYSASPTARLCHGIQSFDSAQPGIRTTAVPYCTLSAKETAL
ncbi:hypothetical protein BDP55DRAFT_1479 [Colletotrichum godetiae]|uniref:Uncharacterized protein n=1 Tax=Colletotrichum godetiae TaxID=1209918 RepID=A0AAJ0F2M8_9PEZI|nr:uncharacterized protein BDP55DRAFT_1479 [Colletotrichum godetiae]KAK1700831.1 hypothetical protein BDP55DRAFT_1479 [Colletotrichum godetiae]